MTKILYYTTRGRKEEWHWINIYTKNIPYVLHYSLFHAPKSNVKKGRKEGRRERKKRGSISIILKIPWRFSPMIRFPFHYCNIISTFKGFSLSPFLLNDFFVLPSLITFKYTIDWLSHYFSIHQTSFLPSLFQTESRVETTTHFILFQPVSLHLPQ